MNTSVRADGRTGRLEILNARGEDIPKRVDDCGLRGEVAYGLTGDDLFDEYMLGSDKSPLGVPNTYDWFDADAQYGRPALCLMNPSGNLPEPGSKVSVAVNRKYERTSRRYLEARLGSASVDFEIATYAGDTENTIKEGTHDCCVEIVVRGAKAADSAMMQTGLQVVEVVRFSDISLIGKVVSRRAGDTDLLEGSNLPRIEQSRIGRHQHQIIDQGRSRNESVRRILMLQIKRPARQSDVEIQRRLPQGSMPEHLADPLLRILGLDGDASLLDQQRHLPGGDRRQP